MMKEDEESSSEESEEEVAKPLQKTPAAQKKAATGKAPKPVKKEESSEESDSSEEKPKTTTTPLPTKTAPTKTAPTSTKATPVKKEESSEEESSEEEVKTKPVTTTKTPVKPTTTTKTPIKSTTAPTSTKVTPAKKEESSEEESSEDETPATTPVKTGNKGVAKPATTTPVKTNGNKVSDEESSGEESSEEIKRINPEDNPKGLKRKRDEVDNSTNKKRKLENGGSTNGGGVSVKVRLGNLSFELDGQVDEIKNQFSDCGEILNVEMIARHDGRWAGVAILEFANQDGANKALEMHDQDFWGRKMSLSYPKEPSGGFGKKKEVSEKPEGCNTVFIGNLNYQITEEEVKEFFSQCGDVRDVRWPKGEFKGFGWVEFSDTDAPDKAIELAGSDLMGRAIRVDYAAPRKTNW